jgi:hypothetical protein
MPPRKTARDIRQQARQETSPYGLKGNPYSRPQSNLFDQNSSGNDRPGEAAASGFNHDRPYSNLFEQFQNSSAISSDLYTYPGSPAPFHNDTTSFPSFPSETLEGPPDLVDALENPFDDFVPHAPPHSDATSSPAAPKETLEGPPDLVNALLNPFDGTIVPPTAPSEAQYTSIPLYDQSPYLSSSSSDLYTGDSFGSSSLEAPTDPSHENTTTAEPSEVSSDNDIHLNSINFQELTGFTKTEFDQLLIPFEAHFLAHMQKKNLDGTDRNETKPYKNRSNSQLSTSESRLLFILHYVKTGEARLDGDQGKRFSMQQITASPWTDTLLSVLRTTANDLMVPTRPQQEQDLGRRLDLARTARGIQQLGQTTFRVTDNDT